MEEDMRGTLEGSADTLVCDRADDLIPEESETVQLALKRLSPKEAYDRVFRMRRAFQVHTTSRIGKVRQEIMLTGYTSAL